MTIRFTIGARGAALGTALAAGALVLGACDVKTALLEPQQPQLIGPGDIQSAAGAEGLYTGALNRLKLSLMGGDPVSGANNQEELWPFEGLLTDEFRSGDTFQQRNEADRRATQSNDNTMGPIYDAVQQARGRARDAINGLRQFEPDSTRKIGEMYLMMGFAETQLAQAFCNGIPLGETANGAPVYTKPLTNAEVYTTAIARFDTALTLLTGTSAATVAVKNAVLIAKARALVNLGKFDEAAALVPASAVPTSYVYNFTFSQPTVDNEWWQMQPNTKRYSVGDSVDAAGVIKNALPFVSAKDPRVPVTGPTGTAFDNTTPYYQQGIWTKRADPVTMVSGLDARLIEAEAKLRAQDLVGMTTILNALRTAPPTLSTFTPAAMTPLVVPATYDDAVRLFFREKAFWQFGRGERLSDLRRMVRLYNLPADQVYPVGAFFKGGTYGSNLMFPVPDREKANPNFSGCLDQKA